MLQHQCCRHTTELYLCPLLYCLACPLLYCLACSLLYCLACSLLYYLACSLLYCLACPLLYCLGCSGPPVQLAVLPLSVRSAYVQLLVASSRLQFVSKDKPLVFLYMRLRHRHILLLNYCLPVGAKHRVLEADELRSNESSRSE